MGTLPVLPLFDRFRLSYTLCPLVNHDPLCFSAASLVLHPKFFVLQLVYLFPSSFSVSKDEFTLPQAPPRFDVTQRGSAAEL